MAARLRFVPPEARSWEPRSVLAGAYRGGQQERELLTHAVWLDAGGDMVGDKSVCRRIDDGHLVDPGGMRGDERVTCPICRQRVEASGLPRATSSTRDPRETRSGARMSQNPSKNVEKLAYEAGFRDGQEHPQFPGRLKPIRQAPSFLEGKELRAWYRGFDDAARRAKKSSTLRRDPPKPGEFERNARRPIQPVILFARGDDLVVVFLLTKNRDGQNMIYRWSGRSFAYADDVITRRNGWRRVRPDDPESREANRLLDHLINDHGWRISAR